ncbi:MAG: prepilin-type N-terminal cleavage/methylation domain-containing protein [bacterium]|nr:prepilin-type N-terminal cleavage/methylation domain-containing protein [bacterium]
MVQTNSKKGQTLVEVIVAIAIAAVAIVGLTDLFITGFDAYDLSRGYTSAVYLAQEKIEEISADKTMAAEDRQRITYYWERKQYTAPEVQVPPGFIQLEVKVKWSDPHGQHSISLVTLKPK